MSGDHIGRENYSILEWLEGICCRSRQGNRKVYFKNKENPKAKVLNSIISYARTPSYPSKTPSTKITPNTPSTSNKSSASQKGMRKRR